MMRQKTTSSNGDKNYQKSNQIETVCLKRFDKSFAKRFLSCALTDKVTRQTNAQTLCDYLCTKFGIQSVTVKITDKAQPHRTNDNGRLKQKTMGLYYPSTHTIVLYNSTAMRHQAVSTKSMFDTLCHEFIHHYDTTKLKLNSIHTRGFYMRISDLQSKIVG